jgi:hypothetical protein
VSSLLEDSLTELRLLDDRDLLHEQKEINIKKALINKRGTINALKISFFVSFGNS